MGRLFWVVMRTRVLAKPHLYYHTTNRPTRPVYCRRQCGVDVGTLGSPIRSNIRIQTREMERLSPLLYACEGPGRPQGIAPTCRIATRATARDRPYMSHSYQGDRKGSPLHITVRFSLLLCACEVENVCGHRENGVLLLMLVPMGVR